MSEIEITQADRDAAAELASRIYGQRIGEMIRVGKVDHHHLVRALTKHRIETLEDARPLIEALVDDLEAEVRDRYCLANGEPHPTLTHKFDRDMVPVNAARAFLGTTP